MRRPSLLRGVLFALVAGLGSGVASFLAGMLHGYDSLVGAYGLACIPLYALAVAPSVRRGAQAFVLATALVLFGLVVSTDVRVVAALSPALIGLVRSGVLFPRALGRAVFLEVLFSGAALLVASFFYDRGPLEVIAAVWSFWLVHAAFALAPGEESQRTAASADPFDSAQRAALAILERTPRDAR